MSFDVRLRMLGPPTLLDLIDLDNPPEPDVTITPGLKDDRVSGRARDDFILTDAGNDTLIGDGGQDSLFGEAGNDRLLGGNGADLLDGGADDDRLFGGASVDTFIISEGRDVATGGAGRDDFVINDNAGLMIVTDWSADDRIVVSGSLAEALIGDADGRIGGRAVFGDTILAQISAQEAADQGLRLSENTAGDAVIRDGGSTLLLRGVGLAEIEASALTFQSMAMNGLDTILF